MIGLPQLGSPVVRTLCPFFWVQASLVKSPTKKRGALIIIWLLGYQVGVPWTQNPKPINGVPQCRAHTWRFMIIYYQLELSPDIWLKAQFTRAADARTVRARAELCKLQLCRCVLRFSFIHAPLETSFDIASLLCIP